MSERAYRERLESDLSRWQAEGLLPPKSADAIRATLRPAPEGITIATPSMPEISHNTMPYSFLGYSLVPQRNDLAFGLAALILAGIEYDKGELAQ